MGIKEFFKKGYYINLDRRVDRKETFEREMDKYGLKDFFERVSAEDGGDNPDFNIRHAHCSLTYYKLFQRIYDEGHEDVVIFEDDAYFYNNDDYNGFDIVNLALDELKNFDWDMFYFGGHPGREMEIVSKHLVHCPYILTTHAVGYKRHVIKRVIDQYKPFYDSAIDGWYAHRPEIKKYLVYPLSVPQIQGVSDLDAQGKTVPVEVFLESFKQTKIIKKLL